MAQCRRWSELDPDLRPTAGSRHRGTSRHRHRPERHDHDLRRDQFRDVSAEPGTVGQPTAGLFKSTDGGASWIQLGSGYPSTNTGNANTFVGQNINEIIVDPSDSNTVYLSASTGVYKSTDAGQNWTQAAGIGGDSRSLALDLTSPRLARILHAGVDGTGVFISTDGGSTFTTTLSVTSPVVVAAAGSNNVSRVAIALAPAATPVDVNGIQVIYAALAAGYNQPDPIGLFQTKDQGGTWTQLAAAGISGTTYGGYAMDIAVDPASPGDGLNDIVFYGCQNQFRSTDAGASFSGLSVGHADTHTWTCVAQSGGSPTIVWCGNDGGVDLSSNGGLAWSSRNSGGLQTGLFYNLAVKPDATASVTVGAMQDNAIETTSGEVPPAWTVGTGGDGWDVAYDGSSPPVLYATSGGPNTVVQPSTNDGVSFGGAITPPWTPSVDTGGFLLNQIAADPSASGILYVSGNQNLWQLLSGTWRIIATLGSTGNVDVAPTDGNHVVIGAGGQVYVSTNALASTVGPPTGVTFTNITNNLPGRNVSRVVFDPVDPNIIYAVLDGFSDDPLFPGQNVYRTTIGSTSWQNISPPLDLPCGALAVDGTTVPSTLYVGSDYGVLRSTDVGASWSVLDEIHFPKVPVYDLAFNAEAGMLRAATYGRGVFEFGVPVGPVISVGLEASLDFGSVCDGTHYLTLTVYNVGVSNLDIIQVERIFGSTDFVVLPTPPTPLTLAPGEDVEFTVSFTPTSVLVSETATIRVTSNDPTAPFVDVAATGLRGAGSVAAAIADDGDFGNVCVGTFKDESLTVNNSGNCTLTIFGIAGTTDFLAPSVISYPLTVAPGASVDIPIRFQPTTAGPMSGTVSIFSDDPASPARVAVSGTGQTPKANLIVADRGSFGNVCVGSFRDEPLLVTNSGDCTLTIKAIASSNSTEFLTPEVLSLPVTVGPGHALPLPIRFQPISFGAKSATITVTSDDPAGPLSVEVSGDAPPGKLAVTGSTTFGGVSAGCCADRTVSICNVGDCALTVGSVRLRRKSRQWKILHNPFPAKVHPGSCLGVVLQYHATERCCRIAELVIESDDPTTPECCIELEAYTIWDDCRLPECDDCRKGSCTRHNCRQGYPCDCQDDRDDD